MNIGDIPADIKAMYPDVERAVMPAIRARASRLRGVDMDDAIQEARIAILSAMMKYDMTKGGLVPYMKTVVANTCHALYGKTKLARVAPRVPVRDGDSWTMVSMRPSSIEVMSEGNNSHPLLERAQARASISADAYTSLQESARDVDAFRRALDARLEPRERQVLQCKTDPPSELVDLVAQDGGDTSCPSSAHIGRFLGMNRNQMGWALYKIRVAFTEAVNDSHLSGPFASLVEGPEWPFIHITVGLDHDAAFVRNTLAERALPDHPEVTDDQACQSGRRRFTRYAWGAVLTVWVTDDGDEECWTAVLEGAFNPRAGEVSGRHGSRLLLPINGYAQLAKALASQRRHKKMSKSLAILPHCVSEYDAGDEVCDGTGDEDPPCAHRDNCVAMRTRMDAKGLTKGSYVKELEDAKGDSYCEPKNLEKFTRILTKTKKAYGIASGKATKVPTSTSKPKASVAEKAKEVAETTGDEVVTRSEAAIELDPTYERWLGVIVDKTGRELATEAPTAGQLFVKDRRDKSGYVGLYCKPAKGRPVGIALIHYKPRNQTMDVKFAAAPGNFGAVSKATMKRLVPVDHRDGVFVAISKGLDESGVILAAEAIAALVNKGTIELPEAS